MIKLEIEKVILKIKEKVRNMTIADELKNKVRCKWKGDKNEFELIKAIDNAKINELRGIPQTKEKVQNKTQQLFEKLYDKNVNEREEIKKIMKLYKDNYPEMFQDKLIQT